MVISFLAVSPDDQAPVADVMECIMWATSPLSECLLGPSRILLIVGSPSRTRQH